MDSSVLSDSLKSLQALCGTNGAIFGYAKDLFLPLMTKVLVMNKQADMDKAKQASKMGSDFVKSAQDKNTVITNKGESLPTFRSH